MYSRKKNSVPKLAQVQTSDSSSANEVTVYSSLLSYINLPIATSKGTREYTKHSLYPRSHFVSFEKCSPSHKSFLMSLNTASPTTLSEAVIL